MPTIEEVLKYNNYMLERYILNKEPFMLECLKDSRIKKKIINGARKWDLILLMQQMEDDYALALFDEEGLKILMNSKEFEFEFNGLMMSHRKYINKLFANKTFCKMFNKEFEKFKSYLTEIDSEAAFNFLNYLGQEDNDKLEEILLNLSPKTQEELLKKIDIPENMLKFCVLRLSSQAVNYLLKNDSRIYTLNDYKYDELIKIFGKKIEVPNKLLEDKQFMKKIYTIESVKDYRFLIEKLAHEKDASNIEKHRKSYYEIQINSYNKSTQMLNRYELCYKELCELIDKNNSNMNSINEIIKKYLNTFQNESSLWDFKKILWDLIVSKDKEKLKQFFINESNIKLSDMIIDYHFEDIPYNFFIDIKELVRFQNTEGRTLNDNDLAIYNKLINIDNLTYEEKINLHNKLKEEDWISKHYEICREAKDMEISLIKEKIINREKLEEYFEPNMSRMFGVPVYTLDGEDFYAFVKTLRVEKKRVLTRDNIKYHVDGSSFSLDGSKKLNTYTDPRINYNLIYSDFPADQVMHIYHVDSFSNFKRGNDEKATQRVYKLYTPEELVEKSADYNEILLVQPNHTTKNNPINDMLQLPSILGIYCYDYLTDQDVESAKNLGVGIVIVRTKEYDVKKQDRESLLDTMVISQERRYIEEIDYLTDVNSNDMVKRRTKNIKNR